jgi:sacsin
VYDFVADSMDIAMQNHMQAFETVMERIDQHLEGTAIRIPLRTKAQGTKSEISGRETTVSEILDVFQSFASDFGKNGLLFMRNVEKLEIGSATGTSIGIEMVDRETLRSYVKQICLFEVRLLNKIQIIGTN